MITNPYKVLGITPEMSEEEAKTVYRNLVKKYHPDKSSGDVRKFREVQEAWKLLKSQGSKAFGRKVGKLTHKTLFTFRRI
ncbi:J domain-containing protein [Clostridium baratii]